MRLGSPVMVPASSAIRVCTVMCLASKAGRRVSIAEAITVAGTMVCISSITLSEVMRLMSSKSSISWAWARALRSMLFSPRCRSAWSRVPRRNTCAQPRMADSGVRNSCDRVVRNSSFNWLVRSASARASRSLSSSTLRSSAARRASTYSRVLSSATAAWAAMAATMRSLRRLNMPGCGWPSSSRPSNWPERDRTGRLRQLRSTGAPSWPSSVPSSGAVCKSLWRIAGPMRRSKAMAAACCAETPLTACATFNKGSFPAASASCSAS